MEIDPLREKWDADHVIPRAITGRDDLEEFKPAHIACHGDKTKEDMKIIKKSNRVQQKNLGLRKSKHGFRGWRKFNGDVVMRGSQSGTS